MTTRKVAYFAGCAANYMEPAVGRATVRVLQENGLRPVFTDQKCCAMPKLANNDIGGFLKNAEFNIQALIKEDCDTVTACTSCALTIKQEYPEALKETETKAVAKRTYDIMEYLVLLHDGKMLNTSFRSLDLKLLYHAPCHLRALGEEMVKARLRLLRKIPGITLQTIERGCCGMGGTFGFKSRNYEMSMSIGKPLFEEIISASPDMIVTECPTCKIQIEQGTGIRVIHPVEIVEKAYQV